MVGNFLHLLIANFRGNLCAKYHENPTMLSRVTAENVGDVFETVSIDMDNISKRN